MSIVSSTSWYGLIIELDTGNVNNIDITKLDLTNIGKIFDKLDAYYSFGGAITFKNAKHNIESLKSVPIDRLVLETDCPYMTPVPFRGKPNEPKYVNLVADKASEVLEISRERIDEITTQNAKRLFYRIK